MRLQLYKMVRKLFICVFLLAIGNGCSKGPYHITNIESYLLGNDYLYMLISREDGIDRASRFQDSQFVIKQRQQLVLARVLLNGGSNRLEVMGRYDQPKAYFDNEAGFTLVSSNAALVETRGGGINLVQFSAKGAEEIPTKYFAGTRFYNSDGSVFFSKLNPVSPGVGQTWAISAFGLVDQSDLATGIANLLGSVIWSAPFVVSPDCSEVLVQMNDGFPTNFLLAKRSNNYRAERLVVPVHQFGRLEGIFPTTNGFLMAMGVVVDQTNEMQTGSRLLICNEHGSEIASTVMGDTYLFDKGLERVVNIPDREKYRIDSISEINIRIWSPFTGADRIVKADVTAINQAFKDH